MGDGGFCAEQRHDAAPFGAMGTCPATAEEHGDGVMGDLMGDRGRQSLAEVAREQIGIEPERVAVPAVVPGTPVLTGGSPGQVEADVGELQPDPFVPRDGLQALRHGRDDVSPRTRCQAGAFDVLALGARDHGALRGR